MFKLLSCCIILSLLPSGNAQRVQTFDIEVDSAVKWSTNILRSKGNHFPGGPTLSARHTSLNALVKNLLSHSDNFFNRWSKSVGLFLTTFYCLYLISITHIDYFLKVTVQITLEVNLGDYQSRFLCLK